MFILINAMFRGVTHPVEFSTTSIRDLYDILTMLERDPVVLEYKVSDSDGPIASLKKTYAWDNNWSKQVQYFDWSKNQ